MSRQNVRDLRAMLVTAGFGTRLSPLTDLLPKPAVPIGNRPAAFFALDHLFRAGIRDFVLNTHHLADRLQEAMRAVAPPTAQLRFVNEPEILGTGGGVKNAWQPRSDETFVVMNGKLLFAPDIAAALALHRARGALATMIVKHVPDSDPTGVVYADDDDQVRSLPGHPMAIATEWRRCMYTGVSLLSAAAHAELPERGCLIRDGYARWIERGARVVAYTEVADFRDVGMSLRHYLEANTALASGQVAWPTIVPDPLRGLCDPSAAVAEGVLLETCVIGADAALAPGTQLERCVVWPRAHASGQHRDAIILPDGRCIKVAP
jgi:NDP-sugar pyrophosphorylase family protein